MDNDETHDRIAGALYDFAGYLTTRHETISVGAGANAAPMADLVKEFANMRSLSTSSPEIATWHRDLVKSVAITRMVVLDGAYRGWVVEKHPGTTEWKVVRPATDLDSSMHHVSMHELIQGTDL